VNGIEHRGSWWSLLFVAVVFGALNASIRPLLTLLSLPIIILTLGLFILVINALMLMITGWVSGVLNLGFHVDGFWAAFLGGLIVAIVSLVLSVFTGVGKTKVHVESRTLRS
jgi:putative membrane protein